MRRRLSKSFENLWFRRKNNDQRPFFQPWQGYLYHCFLTRRNAIHIALWPSSFFKTTDLIGIWLLSLLTGFLRGGVFCKICHRFCRCGYCLECDQAWWNSPIMIDIPIRKLLVCFGLVHTTFRNMTFIYSRRRKQWMIWEREGGERFRLLFSFE